MATTAADGTGDDEGGGGTGSVAVILGAVAALAGLGAAGLLLYQRRQRALLDDLQLADRSSPGPEQGWTAPPGSVPADPVPPGTGAASFRTESFGAGSSGAADDDLLEGELVDDADSTGGPDPDPEGGHDPWRPS